MQLQKEQIAEAAKRSKRQARQRLEQQVQAAEVGWLSTTGFGSASRAPAAHSTAALHVIPHVGPSASR